MQKESKHNISNSWGTSQMVILREQPIWESKTLKPFNPLTRTDKRQGLWLKMCHDASQKMETGWNKEAPCGAEMTGLTSRSTCRPPSPQSGVSNRLSAHKWCIGPFRQPRKLQQHKFASIATTDRTWRALVQRWRKFELVNFSRL